MWAAGCVAARLVAAVQLFGVPAVFPSSFVLSSWTLVVGLTSGFPWFMSCHVELPMHTQPLFSWAGCVCVCVDLLNRSKTCTVFAAGGHSISLGLCPTKLPVIWDTGSDQSSVPARRTSWM